MAGLESFNMDYQRHRPSRSISEVQSLQQQNNFTDPEIVRQQQRETLMEMSRKKGNFNMVS